MVSLIWATRGRSWGFRFLLDGGYEDPLSAYERAFAGLEGQPTAFRRVGQRVALRFPDPEDRADVAGRIIPHDFVVLEPIAGDIHSVDDGRQKVWPLVADVYARLWRGSAPSATAARSALDSASRRAFDAGPSVDNL